jgi:DnaK suppressor protein
MAKTTTKRAATKKTRRAKSSGAKRHGFRTAGRGVPGTANVKGEQQSYAQKDLEHFKQIILQQKKEMVEELQSLSERMVDAITGEYPTENSTYSMHMAEQGTDAMEREKAFLFAQRGDDYIKHLDEALERIKNGSYGRCVVCGKLIEKGRLEAVPTTQKHVNCKNRVKRLRQET